MYIFVSSVKKLHLTARDIKLIVCFVCVDCESHIKEYSCLATL